jgi:hypothetical protein
LRLAVAVAGGEPGDAPEWGSRWTYSHMFPSIREATVARLDETLRGVMEQCGSEKAGEAGFQGLL